MSSIIINADIGRTAANVINASMLDELAFTKWNIIFNREISMTAYILGQEYNDLHWGTRMPVALMIGSDFFQVRARGDCSLAVQDIQKLQAQIPDPEDLTTYLGSLLSSSITDVIGELSIQVSNIAQLTEVTEQTLSSLQSNLEPKCSQLGLQLKALRIEAIESI